jgi:DNA-binding beta-propeller fold protein YncE
MTRTSRWSAGAVLLIGSAVLGSAGILPRGSAAVRAYAPESTVADTIAPRFEADPSWPKPLPEGTSWPELTRAATSVAADSRDHVWAFYVLSQAARDAEAAGKTVPRLFEFDPAGNLVRAWGGPGPGYQWMEAIVPTPIWPSGTPPEHGMFIDREDNVWVTGNGHVALKFSREGRFLLQIGELWKTNGSNDRKLLGNPCELTVDPATNELYIADGYINRRVVVFDAATGAYKRHWGAYGKRPTDLRLLKEKDGLIADPAEFYLPGGPPQPQWLGVHCVRVSRDGFVYVCDRSRNRIQVFKRNGAFVRELQVAGDTPVELGFIPGARGAGFGAPSTIGFSQDPEQRFLYLGDNMNAKIWIFRRRDLQLLGSFPTKARANHYLTVDSHGNIYNSGLQKFAYKGVPSSLDERLRRSGAER